MIHNVLAEQGSNVSEISYHVPWCGYDPWNADNSEHSHARELYYDINEIPVAFFDGHAMYYGSTEEAVRTALESRLQIPSHLWMSLQGWSDIGPDSLFLEVKIA